MGITYEFASEGETGDEYAKRIRRVNYRIKTVQQKLQNSEINTPDAPHTFGDDILDKALDHIRAFEIKQMTYELSECSVCNERRIEMHMATAANITVCRRCFSDKQSVKMFSAENNMDPKPLPAELQDLSIVEQQLICRIAPCINIHMLKHGGISSNGHCVTFPQEINEPAKIFPRLPNEVKIIKVCKKGKNNTSKDFKVRRFYVQNALIWLKQNNPVYSDIQISQERLNKLPLDAECDGVPSVEFSEDTVHNNDLGPAPEQIDTGECEGNTNSSVLLPDAPLSIQTEINNVVQDVLGNDAEVSSNRQGTCTIPWPTRDNIPVSEYTTANFFTMAFPALFPYGYADLFSNRPRTCSSMSDWADHLLWYKDGRFAHHQYFKFVVHNMIMRKRAAENAKFIVNQKLGDSHLTVADLKEQLKSGNQSIGKKIFYFGTSLRGTTQYWAQRGRELRALIQYKINQGDGLPSYFCTASCAEFHFKPLHRLLSMYIEATTGKPVDLSDRNQLFQALQHNTHIVAKYFDLRTQSYFKEVMSPVFNVNAYWYRQEFAKSRGMVHWHGLCWRSDKQPHQLLFEAVQNGLSDDNCANRLAQWAEKNIGMTALHPAGKDETGESRKDMWPPPEGNAPPPPEEKNPLLKLLLDVSSSQASLLEDHLLLTNRFNIHRCSDYCLTVLRKSNPQTKSCRMEFPKEIRDTPGIIKDRNKAMRLEMPRDHPMLVQHSKLHTQGWRANGDISLILSKSGTENPSVDDIMATEKYITGYACKGNQPTGAVADLFNDVISCTDDTEGAKSLCSKLLMGTIKRDISAVEASYELSALPLYRSSHTFQSVSLSGSRVLENNGSRVTKSTPLDRYLERAKDDSSSFYQFICKSGKVPVISGSGIQASWPLEDTFCKNMLLLHWPNWRKISELKDEAHSWTLQFQYFLETDKCPNFLKAEVDRVKKQNDTSLDEDDENEGVAYLDESGQPEWMDLVRPVVTFDDIQKEFFFNDGGPEYNWSKASYKYPQGLGTSWIESLNESSELGNQDLVFPEVDLTSMNEDQKFAFNIVMQTLFDFVERENADNLFQPLRMVVMGKAGSGKSFLIKCLVKAIRTLFKSNKSVQVVCPTGNSANLIDGVTLHSFLKIPTYNQGGEMKPPDGSIGATLQENCTGLRALIVDGRSLVGSTTFGWMEYMCSQGMAAQLDQSVSWGGLPVVVVLGDEVQLPPVLDSPVYKNSSKSPAAIHGVLIWKEFETVVELQNIIRQANDEQVYRNVLMALREYKLSKEQAAWLQELQWDRLKSRYGDELSKRMEMSGLFVFPTHDEEWNHNKDQLIKANEIYPVAKIKSVSKGSHSNTDDSDKAGGLLRVLYICKNAKVMLTCNLNVPFGLFNGATGKVVDILYQSGRRPPDCFPDVVMVHFHSYTGPPFISEDPKVVPIVPVSRRIDCKCHYCCRTQIPLRLGWATTIHRCQGMTIGSGEANRYIVIHPGTKAFESRNPGALYVALSRAKCSGAGGRDPDFAWNSNVRVNEDRLVMRLQHQQA